jgi:hypothetical protein
MLYQLFLLMLSEFNPSEFKQTMALILFPFLAKIDDDKIF